MLRVAQGNRRKGWSSGTALTAALLGAAMHCCFAIQSPEPSFADGAYMVCFVRAAGVLTDGWKQRGVNAMSFFLHGN